MVDTKLRFFCVIFIFVLQSCATKTSDVAPHEGGAAQQVPDRAAENAANQDAGCYLGLSGGIQSVYLVSGFLKVLAQEKIIIRGVTATEAPALAAAWFAWKRRAFDLDWMSTKLILSDFEPSRWKWKADESTPLERWLEKNLAIKAFGETSIPLVISWYDRLSGRLILSSRGGLREPLLSALSFPGVTSDANVGSGNEHTVLPMESERLFGSDPRPWVWLHVHETVQGSSAEAVHWNAWRTLIHQNVRSRAQVERHLLLSARLRDEKLWDNARQNQLFREGEALARSSLSSIRSHCKNP